MDPAFDISALVETFISWLDGFLGIRDLAALLVPATTVDASDGQPAHFAGLNMSRAWMLQGLASALRDDDSRVELFQSLAQAHLDGGLRNALEDDYMISHWAPSFVLYVLSKRGLSTEMR